jgi:ribosomal protein L6P/L9E
MSNKINKIFQFKGMVLKENLPEYKFLTKADNSLICSINLPNKVLFDKTLSENCLKIIVDDSKKTKNLKAKLGFISNFIYENVRLKKKLLVRSIFLVGTGFKVFNSKINKGHEFIFKIGLSHLIKVIIPENITFEIKKLNEIKFFSYDKELLGSFLNFVASMRFPDSYKGRGLLISNQPKVKLKKGKVKS